MPATILVADDDRDLLRLTTLALRSAGYTVLTAGDGAFALAVAERERPDLVVSDVMMPGLSGVELVARLRGDGDDGPPALLMSGIVWQTALPPRTAFLPKPFDVARLLREVARLLPRPA